MFKHQFHHQYDLPFTSILHHNLSPYWHGQIYFILFSLTQRQLEWLNLRSTHVNFYLSKVLLKSVSKEILGCNSVLVEPSEPLVRLKEASSRLYYLPIRFQVILLGWYSRILKCLEFIYLKKLGGLEVWHGQVMELCPVVHSGREICNTLFWEGHCGFSPDLGKKIGILHSHLENTDGNGLFFWWEDWGSRWRLWAIPILEWCRKSPVYC